METMLYKLQQIYFYIRNLPSRIIAFIRWWPVIWKDRDWDYIFFYDLIIYKIDKMEKCMAQGTALDAYKKADKLMEIKNLLVQVRDERLWHDDLEFKVSVAQDTWHDSIEEDIRGDQKLWIRYKKLRDQKDAKLAKMRRKAFRDLDKYIDKMWD